MNADERKRLRELCGKATPGPWELEERGYSVCPFKAGDKVRVTSLPNGGFKLA